MCKPKNWSEVELKQRTERFELEWEIVGVVLLELFSLTGLYKIYKLKTPFNSTHIFQVHTV